MIIEIYRKTPGGAKNTRFARGRQVHIGGATPYSNIYNNFFFVTIAYK